MTFLNAAIGIGLLAALVPPLIHLFSRTRYDEVDWAAMRFLTVNPKVRRRKRLDQILLLLLRCAVIGLLVFALAAPAVPGSSLPSFTGSGPKDVVLLIDNSASTAGPPAEAAKTWAKRYLSRLGENDRAAVYAVRKSLTPLAPAWTTDGSATSRLELLPTPAGTADWPSAVASAVNLFDDPTRERHVIAITDGQRYSLADETTLPRWPLALPKESQPRVWLVPLISDRKAEAARVEIEPVATTRGVIVANRDVTFSTLVRTTVGPTPAKLKIEWDGRPAGEVAVGPDGRVAVTRRFPAGSHLLTLLSGLSRQDFAFEAVSAVPVLIADGDPKADGRGVNFLRTALAPAKDPAAGFAVSVVPASSFGSATLQQDVAGPGTPPRVLVLANVAKITTEQSRAVEQFLQSGGGVLVAPGDRVEAASWNSIALRGGQGWLPARFDRVAESERATPMPAVSSHPALAAFKDPLPGGLHTATFPKYWKLDPTTAGPGGSVACSLSSGDPFLIDRGVGRGRVLMSAVPFDSSWQSTFPTLPDFVRLAHELTYSLAGTQSADRNLSAGTAIAFTPRPSEPPAGVTVLAPDAVPKVISVSAWPMVYAETAVAGAYRLTTAAGRTTFFAVRDDPRERDLTPISDDDRAALEKAGLTLIAEPGEVDASRPTTGGAAPKREIWWLAMIGVLALLAGELWYVRRLSGEPRQS